MHGCVCVVARRAGGRKETPREMAIEVGTITTGTVVRVTDYGAIVRLPGGDVGLVHISEIADTFVRNVRDYLHETDEVMVRVLGINNRGRYELSIRRCGATPGRVERVSAAVGAPAGRQQPDPSPRFFDSPHAARPALTFEDRLSRFLKDSNERQLDLRRHLDAKRGRR